MFDYMDANRCKEMNFAFVRLPILLFTAAAYKSLSIDAKLLFAFLLDRTGLSAKNEWRDAQNRIYIQYPLAEISERFGFGVHKAGKLLRDRSAVCFNGERNRQAGHGTAESPCQERRSELHPPS